MCDHLKGAKQTSEREGKRFPARPQAHQVHIEEMGSRAKQSTPGREAHRQRSDRDRLARSNHIVLETAMSQTQNQSNIAKIKKKRNSK